MRGSLASFDNTSMIRSMSIKPDEASRIRNNLNEILIEKDKIIKKHNLSDDDEPE